MEICVFPSQRCFERRVNVRNTLLNLWIRTVRWMAPSRWRQTFEITSGDWDYCSASVIERSRHQRKTSLDSSAINNTLIQTVNEVDWKIPEAVLIVFVCEDSRYCLCFVLESFVKAHRFGLVWFGQHVFWLSSSVFYAKQQHLRKRTMVLLQ